MVSIASIAHERFGRRWHPTRNAHGARRACGRVAELAGPGKERLVALTDGIFAFAMTLLVLGIGVPNPATTSPSDLPRYLRDALPEMAIVAVSFAVCGVYWVGHHQQFHLVHRTDRPLLWLNNAFLLAVVFLPFSTGMLGHYPTERIALLAYGLNLLAISAALNAMRLWVGRRSLHVPGVERAVFAMARRRQLVAVPVIAAALLAAFVDARISLALFAALPVYYIIPGRVDKHLGHQEGAHDGPRR
jgi:uncharacterized membrane protein